MKSKSIAVLLIGGILMLSSLAMASTQVQSIDKLLSEQKFFEALVAIHQLFIEVWNKSPLKIVNMRFVNKVDSVGMYEQRKTDVFKPEEKMLVYIRPVGYTLFKKDGKYRFGVILSVALLNAKGEKIFERKGWGKFLWASYIPNTEMYLRVRMTFEGIRPGKYTLRIVLSDLFSDKVASGELPFVVSE